MLTHDYRVLRSSRVFTGRVLSLRSDEVAMPGDTSSQRDVAELPGAVAVVPLHEDGSVLLVRQYRHPVARPLWEVPAGLLDSTTESPLEAGRRELLEEAGLWAGRWDLLADVLTSPGMTDETIRLLLARDLQPTPEHVRPRLFHEEAELESIRIPLSEAVAQIFVGRIENGITVAALLAAYVAVADERELLPVEAPWLARKR